MPRIGGLAALDDVVPETRTISTTPPLTGGGDFTADRTLAVQVGTSGGTVAAGNDARFTDARAWALYSGSATPGQVPTWTGTVFTPQTPSGGSGGGLDAEAVRDTIATALVAGDNISIDHDDPNNTITISAAGGSGGTTSDATTTTKGILRLAGDLAGTANNPTVPGAQKTTEKSTAATPVPDGYIGADTSGRVAAALLPAASTSNSGILQLAGDLGGTASAPTITRRAPIGGHQQLTYASTVTPNAALGNSFHITATGGLTIAPPTGGVDGQQLLIEVYASGGSRVVQVSGSTTFLTGLPTSMTVSSGEVGYVGLKYSTRAGHWVVLAIGQEA